MFCATILCLLDFLVHCLFTNEYERFFLKGIALRKVLLQNYLFNKKSMKADLAELGAGGLLQLKYYSYD